MRRASITRWDLAIGVGIVLLTLVTRLPGLALRGQWDADQANELLVLLHWVRDGQVPLLGPSTFAGTFHHGALYYYLLAPVAFLTDVDPNAILGWIAVLGILAVGATWALGAAVGGRWTGYVAGVLAAVSPAYILGSTFIWNPNPVTLGSALALLGAVLAWRRASPRWWLLSAAGCALAMQLHVSGGLLLPPLVVAWALDARRGGGRRGRLLGVGLGAALILAAGYLPLAASELQTGFRDTHGLLGYLGGGGAGSGDLAIKLIVVAVRSLAWPFVGPIVDAPLLSLVIAIAVIVLGIVALRRASPEERPGLALLVGVFLWSVPALALTAPTLLTAIAGLPNDHYHLYLDPAVIVVVASGLAAIGGFLGRRDAPGTATTLERIASVAGVVALVAVGVTRWPPATSPDGSWPLADAAAAHLIETRDVGAATLVGLPDVKPPDSIRFPLERRGAAPLAPDPSEPATNVVVLVCDPLFDELTGAPCGGEAERRYAQAQGLSPEPLEQFTAGDRRIITVLQR